MRKTLERLAGARHWRGRQGRTGSMVCKAQFAVAARVTRLPLLRLVVLSGFGAVAKDVEKLELGVENVGDKISADVPGSLDRGCRVFGAASSN